MILFFSSLLLVLNHHGKGYHTFERDYVIKNGCGAEFRIVNPVHNFVNPVHKILRNFSKNFKTKNISLCVLLNLKISTFLQKRECPAPSVDFL